MDNRALQEEAALKYQQWREETVKITYLKYAKNQNQ